MSDSRTRVQFGGPETLLALGAATMWGALLTLWLGKAEWTDYAGISLIAVAFTLLAISGVTWIDRSFNTEKAER